MRVCVRTAVVATAALVLVGCGVDDGPSSSDGADAVDGDGPGADADDASDDTTDDGPAAATGDSGADVLNELLERAAAATYQVTYDVTADGTATTLTLAHDGPNTAVVIEGQKVIQTGTDVIACSEGECFAIPSGMMQLDAMLGAMMGPFAATVALESEGLFAPGVDVDLDDDTIVGRDVLCATVSGSFLATTGSGNVDPDASYTACADREVGVLLRLASSVDGSVLEATAFSTSVDADAFTPPFPVQQPGG